MRKQKQLHRHFPEDGIFGDCDRTVIACLLDKAPEEVYHWGQHYEQGDRFNEEKTKYLLSQGLVITRTAYHGTDSLEDVLKSVGGNNPNVYYMLTGMSRTGVNHVVICLNNAIHWDTSQDNSGIVGPATDGFWHIEFLSPSFLRHETDDAPV